MMGQRRPGDNRHLPNTRPWVVIPLAVSQGDPPLSAFLSSSMVTVDAELIFLTLHAILDLGLLHYALMFVYKYHIAYNSGVVH